MGKGEKEDEKRKGKKKKEERGEGEKGERKEKKRRNLDDEGKIFIIEMVVDKRKMKRIKRGNDKSGVREE
ncbi:hypothetical protein, partial [Klebsiella pneumoniae]|uniref:hypothetical protein n=1 Tax=Klebsiella pneumoniae TaxID=573 RepID=UPI000FF3C055